MKFEQCGSFHDGLAPVKELGGGYGVINREGHYVIPSIYGFISDFSEELAVCSTNGKYGFISKTGQLVIPLMYAYALPFRNGYAKVWNTIISEKVSHDVVAEKYADEGYVDRNNQQFWLKK